jgi:hypothetical protein
MTWTFQNVQTHIEHYSIESLDIPTRRIMIDQLDRHINHGNKLLILFCRGCPSGRIEDIRLELSLRLEIDEHKKLRTEIENSLSSS